MNVDRLKLLVTLLCEIRNNKNRNTIFTLVGWYSKSNQIEEAVDEVFDLIDYDSEISHKDIKEVLKSSNGGFLPENFCGTTACAVGHACLDKRFNELGLTLWNGSPVYNGVSSWDAVIEFFDITEDEAEWLFYDKKYPNRERTTVDEVIERINTLIKDFEITSSNE